MARDTKVEGEPRALLAPLLNVAAIAHGRGRDAGLAEALQVAQQILQQVADERGSTVYAVLAEVRERFAGEVGRIRGTGIRVRGDEV